VAVVLAAVLVMTASSPASAWAAGPTHTVSLTVTQTFTTDSPAVDDTFTYRLTALDPSHPMPADAETLAAEGSVVVSTVFTMSGQGSVTIGPIAYDSAGVYHYDLAQVVEAPRAGYTYDQRVYRVQAHIPDNPHEPATVIVRDGHAAGDKVEDIHFDNRFDQLSTPETATPPYPPRAPTGGRLA
jgi:hypothetical protein